MKLDHKVLTALDLTENEVSVFLSLQKKPQTLRQVTQDIGQPQSDIDDALYGLKEKYLISKSGAVFRTATDSRIREFAKQRVDTLRGVVDELTNKMSLLENGFKIEGERVQVFYGKEGVYRVIEKMKNLGNLKTSIFREITDVDAMYSILSQYDLISLRSALRNNQEYIIGLYSGKIARGKVQQTYGERYAIPKKLWGFEGNISVHGDPCRSTTCATNSF